MNTCRCEHSELTLQEMLQDPIVMLLMEKDRVSSEDFKTLFPVLASNSEESEIHPSSCTCSCQTH